MVMENGSYNQEELEKNALKRSEETDAGGSMYAAALSQSRSDGDFLSDVLDTCDAKTCNAGSLDSTDKQDGLISSNAKLPVTKSFRPSSLMAKSKKKGSEINTSTSGSSGSVADKGISAKKARGANIEKNLGFIEVGNHVDTSSQDVNILKSTANAETKSVSIHNEVGLLAEEDPWSVEDEYDPTKPNDYEIFIHCKEQEEERSLQKVLAEREVAKIEVRRRKYEKESLDAALRLGNTSSTLEPGAGRGRSTILPAWVLEKQKEGAL